MEKENYGGNRLTQVHLNKWPLKWSVCVRMMEVVVTAGAVRCVKLQSDCHHQQTNTQLSTGWMFFLSPNQQCQSTEGKSDTYWLLCINPSLVSLQGQPKNSLWVLLGARLVLNAGCPSCHPTNCDEALKNSLERCCISESCPYKKHFLYFSILSRSSLLESAYGPHKDYFNTVRGRNDVEEFSGILRNLTFLSSLKLNPNYDYVHDEPKKLPLSFLRYLQFLLTDFYRLFCHHSNRLL